MAIEKMKMVSAVGSKNDIDKVTELFVDYGGFHVIDAIHHIDEYDAESSKKVKTDVLDNRNKFNDSTVKRIVEIMDMTGINQTINEDYKRDEKYLQNATQRIDKIYNKVFKFKKTLDKCEKNLNDLNELQKKIKDIRTLKFSLDELRSLNYFNFKIGRVGKDNYVKMKENYENIPSIIQKVNTMKKYMVVAAFTPMYALQETEDILKSLGFEEISLPQDINGMPGEILKSVDEMIDDIVKQREKTFNKINAIRHEYGDFIKCCYISSQKMIKQNLINEKAVYTEDTFYISGWVPENDYEDLIGKFDMAECNVEFVANDNENAKNQIPPTKLKNNKFAKPFEYFVKMYGLPSYNEIDPTLFVAISYMIMFGVMFGDLGQGFILLSGGLILSRFMGKVDFGGILTRIGASSMFFGLLYGSIFGNEHIIRPLLIRPLENINSILIGSVILGIILATISFVFNFINAKKKKEIQEGLFGSEGVIGFVLYWAILVSVLYIIKNGELPLPTPIMIGIFIVLIALIILRQPLSSVLKREKPLHKDHIGDYYIESTFGIVETLLGMFSKTVSFVRLGAFALNHVGLFIAFSTLAEMADSKVAGIVIMIIGNIIIIGLEGLVVFIQGLRLEYFELFGRFFKGGGKEYNPVKLYDKSKLNK